MIVRYPLKCNGCGVITILRIAVSHRDRDPFHFECEECHREISGIFVTDQQAAAVKGIEDLRGAALSETEDGAKYFHLYSSDFATETSQESVTGLSPFLTAHMMLGPQFVERMGRIAQFYGLVENDGAELKGIARQFSEGNRKQFRLSVSRYLDWPLDEPIDQQRALFQLFELMLGPLFHSESHVSLVSKMYSELKHLFKDKKPAFIAFVDDALVRGYLKSSRQELLDQLLRFLEEADDFRSVLPFWDAADQNAAFPPELAVRAPRSFNQLKSFYVDLYEAVARSLTLVTAIGNLVHRGDHNAYQPHPTLRDKFAPRSMADFHTKNSAPKLAYLADLSWLSEWVQPSMDAKLRNAIGHNSSRYNPKTGNIDYQLDGAGTVRSISYGDFLFAILRLVRTSLQLAHLTKQLYVFDHFRGMDMSGAPGPVA